MRDRVNTFSLVLPLAFAALAAFCRWTIRVGVETRYQILALWIFAALLEYAMREDGAPVARVRLGASWVAIGAAQIAMKACIEGIPELHGHLLR